MGRDWLLLGGVKSEVQHPRDETELARDLQVHFAFALLGLPVEGTADREGSPRPSGDPLHAHLSRLSAVASAWLF